MSDLCQDHPATFGGFLFELLAGAVVGAVIHPFAGWLAGSKKSGRDWLDSLLVRSMLFYNGFALMAHIPHGLLGVVCQFNVIGILGAGNLDQVNGFNVFDTQWIRIAITLYFMYRALAYQLSHFSLAQEFSISALATYAVFGFVLSRATEYATVWVMFFGQLGAVLLFLTTSYFYISSTKLLNWKPFVMLAPIFLYLALNWMFGLANNTRYHWFGDKIQVYIYPTISIATVSLQSIIGIIVIPLTKGRFGDPANKYGNLIPPEEREREIKQNKQSGTYKSW